jgi:hypothetical protein
MISSIDISARSSARIAAGVANLAWRQIFREILKGRAVFDPPIPGGLKRLAIRA